MTAKLTAGQLSAIGTIEKICSVFSFLGCLFVITTFCMSRAFHKPINRIVLYATFGNMMSNIGTLMSRSFLTDIHSAGCQCQAFILQMFMPADAYWTLAMAVNVYLTFYYKFDAIALRRMEILYIILCYGVPMMPALVFIFLKDSSGTRVYGNAVLWCWISLDWDALRIASFYGPIWLVILVTFFIYIRAGRTIYEVRKRLQSFHSADLEPRSFGNSLNRLTKTVEVVVTSRPISGTENSPHFEPAGQRTSITSSQPQSSPRSLVYSTAPSDNRAASAPSISDVQCSIDGAKFAQENVRNFGTVSEQHHTTRMLSQANRRNRELNDAAWTYTKCAILFFSAILITWTPSSANRVYTIIHRGQVSVVLNFMSAFVLPLQGFWNAVIYTFTSWSACKDLLRDLRKGRAPDATELVTVMLRDSSHAGGPGQQPQVGMHARHFGRGLSSRSKLSNRLKPFDTMSAKELRISYPTTEPGSY